MIDAAGEGSRRGPAACQDQGGGDVRDSSDKSWRRSFSAFTLV